MKKKLIIYCILAVIVACIIELAAAAVKAQSLEIQSFLTFLFKKRLIALIFVVIGLTLIFSFFGKKIVVYLHKFRYLIGILLLVLLVALNISGSSIGYLSTYLQDAENPVSEDVIFGISRFERTDEWGKITPLAFSQDFNDYGYRSSIPRAEDTDMYMVFGQPVKDISIIFRPSQIGYLLFGPDRGLAFQWWSRLITLFLISYEFMLLLTKKKKGLSFAAALLISFSPLIQWWYSSNFLIEMIIFVELAILAFDKYLLSKNTLPRTGWACLIMYCCGCFIFTMYPACMVPMAYVLLAFIIWIIIKDYKFTKLKLKDILLTLCVVVVFGALIGRTIYMSMDAISATLSTAYPGGRAVAGGGALRNFFDYPMTLISSFNKANVLSSHTEDSRFFDLFPLGILLAIFVITKSKKKHGIDPLLVCSLVVFLILFIYCSFGLPPLIAKLSLLDKSMPNRVMFVTGFINLVILFRSISLLIEYKIKIDIKAAIVVSIALFILLFSINYPTYKNLEIKVATIWIIASCLIAATLAYLYLKHSSSKMLIFGIFLTVMLSGMFVNPIRIGTDIVFKQGFTEKVKDIATTDRDAKWVHNGDFIIGNVLIMNGAKTINSVNTYPNNTLWKLVDRQNSENVYNRFAIISINIYDKDTDFQSQFELRNDDYFVFNTTLDELKQMNVKYISSKENLSNKNRNSCEITELFNNDNRDYIYRID